MNQVNLRTSVGVFLVAMAVLLAELMLTRVFDVILYGSLGYVVITCVMFALGLAGVYTAWRPVTADNAGSKLAGQCAGLAVTLALLLSALNLNPFWYDSLGDEPVKQMLLFGAMYLTLLLPFFMAGLVFSTVFSLYASGIRRLYCWDLTGAALGCVLAVVLVRPVKPGGAILLASAAVTGAVLLAGLPWLLPDGSIEFREHANKRGVISAQRADRIEHIEWDPISKIQVITDHELRLEDGGPPLQRKHVAYDGGNQSTHFTQFDGDHATLRAQVEAGAERGNAHFWRRGVLLSHYLRRDRGHTALIIGSAGGQETKAALLFNPGHVDGIELVGTVVRLGMTTYADFIGGIFNDPRVTNRTGEGRSFIRASSDRYDVIQMFSNHTSSMIGSGNGAAQSTYLQTVEAYLEYFTHLKPDGILHENHHVYPRMMATLAVAWHRLGRSDLRRHVMLFGLDGRDHLPTLLVKMSPWTEAEVAQAVAFMARHDDPTKAERLMISPLPDGPCTLPAGFFEPRLPAALVDAAPFRVGPCTDDRPFFNYLSRLYEPVEPDRSVGLDPATANVLNARLQGGWMPKDRMPFAITGSVAIVFALVFTLVPLRVAGVGRRPWPGKFAAMGYFSCLGAGFIIIELVFIQVFMKLVGFPLYTYSVVLCTMLLAAGVGSLLAGYWDISPARRGWVPFAGTLAYGAVLLAVYPAVFELFLASPTPVRIAVAAAMILPIGLFMGMPFPLGVLAVERQPAGAVAWAWAMNGLFTVIGGVVSTLLGIYIGFRAALVMGLLIYAVAWVLFVVMRRAATDVPQPVMDEAAAPDPAPALPVPVPV